MMVKSTTRRIDALKQHYEIKQVLIIKCCCPELNNSVVPTLDIKKDAALVLSIAGAWGGREGQEILRSATLGLLLFDCSEIIVVGHRGCIYCPVDRGQVRKYLEKAHLPKSATGHELSLDNLRGPSSPDIGVLETVRALRQILAPKAVPIVGYIYDSSSGLLEAIDTKQKKDIRVDGNVGNSVILTDENLYVKGGIVAKKTASALF